MTRPAFDLKTDEHIIWDAPIDDQLMSSANNKSRLIYGGGSIAMVVLALYLLLLFINGFWGANEDTRSARLVATLITGPGILVALIALWAFIERLRLIGPHTMPSHYFVTNHRIVSTKEDGEFFDEIDNTDISHTSIDGQSQTQILIVARTTSDKEEERKPPFLFIHLEDLNAVKALVDQHIPNDE